MTQDQALAILKTGANVFLTGEPGSGKTHTVNQYIEYLRDTGIEPAITASTGIAATHIGGMTIHSWSGIGIKRTLDEYALDKIASTKYVVHRVRRARVLIIDEVSMLLPETLAMVDAVCKEIKQRNESFGGLQIVLVGDFFQLPPVSKTEIDPQKSLLEEQKLHFAYESASWKNAKPFACYLTEQHRQDDKNYLEVLGAIRKNEFSNDHLSYIKSRKTERQNAPQNVPTLFSHNANVDTLNSQILDKLPGETYVFKMSSAGPEPLVESLKRGCLSPELLRLKAGAAVMFTKNNAKEGFVNGSVGVVERMEHVRKNPIVKITGLGRIEVERMEWRIEEEGKIKAEVSQLPLRLAWAITVHKSQGMSMDEAVMDLSGVFEYGQGYVALSRVRRLSGLHLLGWNEQTFKVHPKVLEKDREFRKMSEEILLFFAKMPPVEILQMHENFIRSCGGKSLSLSAVSAMNPKRKRERGRK